MKVGGSNIPEGKVVLFVFVLCLLRSVLEEEVFLDIGH